MMGLHARRKDWFLRIATDADLGRPDRRLVVAEPDCDICRECKEHSEFEHDEESGETLSVCCGAPACDD